MTENRSGLEMKSVAGWSASSSGPRSQARSNSVPSRSRRCGWKANGQRDQRPASQREPALHEGDAKAGQRAELRPDDHRADDRDHRVGQNPDAGDQRREHHEGEEAARELRALGGAGLDLLPDDSVGRRARGCLLGCLVRQVENERCRLSRSRSCPARGRPRARSSERTTTVSSRATSRGPASSRLARYTGEMDDVDHRRLPLEHSEDAFRERGWRDHSEVDHLRIGRVALRARRTRAAFESVRRRR